MGKIKKVGLLIVLALVFALAVAPGVRVHAGDNGPNFHSGSKADGYFDYFKENGVWYIVTKKPDGTKHGQAYVAGAMDSVSKLVVPAGLKHSKKDYDILGVNDWAFKDSTKIKSLEIKNGVKYIGEYAFNGCSKLTTVKIGNSVNEIGPNAFSDNPKLKTINIPDSLKSIPSGMLSNDQALKSIKLGKNVKKIEYAAFMNCFALKKVTLNKALTEIGESAFGNCKALPKIKFTSNIKKLGNSAFYYCESLQSVSLPKKVKVVPNSCFGYCASLTSVKLPAGITTIENGAFNLCENLTEVTGDNKNLKKIESNAFSVCPKLESIELEYVTEIGENTFSGSSLSKVTFSEELTSLGRSAFSETKITEIKIPGSLKEVPDEAFCRCENLKKVYFGNGVEKVGASAFQNCKKLDDIYIPASINYVTATSFERTPWFESEQGKTFHETDNGGFYSYDVDGGGYDYSKCPDSICVNSVCIWVNKYEYYINEYGKWASKGGKEVITFPKVKVVNCNLGVENETKKVVIPEGVTELGGFINLGGMFASGGDVDLVLPSTLKKINASIKGSRLKSITLPASLEELGGMGLVGYGLGGFGNAENLEKVTFLGKKLKEIKEGCFQNDKKLGEITIPEGVVSIGDNAFYNSGLTKVKLPSTLKKIGSRAFADTSITSVDLPDDITEFDWNAFSGTVKFYVKKSSKTHKALKEFLSNNSGGFTVEFK